MTAADLEISHSVEFEVSLNGKKSTLLTTVEEVINRTVLLTPIQLNGKIVGFPPPFTVNFLYVSDDQVFCWRNVQVKAVRYEGRVYHSVTLPGSAEELNRRGAYRVYIGQRMNLISFTSTGSQMHEVLVRDLSETGMSFLSTEEFTVGRTVRLHLKQKSGAELTLSAQVLWKRDSKNRKGKYIYGCKLIERNRMLANYLMNAQQERQRKRMGL